METTPNSTTPILETDRVNLTPEQRFASERRKYFAQQGMTPARSFVHPCSKDDNKTLEWLD